MKRRGVRAGAVFALALCGGATARAAAPAGGPARTEVHGGASWSFAEADRPALARVLALYRRLVPRPGTPGGRVAVILLSDIEAMAQADGDTRFATFRRSEDVVEIHVAADAPAAPDLVTPVFASALFLARHPAAQRLPLLLAGYGAYRANDWWGRTPQEWGALLAAGDLLPAARELMASDERAADDLLAVGAAAAAIRAWASREGRSRVEDALASGVAEEGNLQRSLAEAAGVASAAPARRRLPDGFLRGVSFAMRNSVEGSYLSRSCGLALDRLRRDWIGAVSVMPFAFQRSASSPEIRLAGHDPHEETEEAVLRAVEAARAAGMVVLVKPQIWLWRGFTGDIAMRSEEDWRSWFRSYRRYVLRYAVVAEAGGAELFDVGVELCAAEKRSGDWRDLISAVRHATGAPLLYSCNWGRGAAVVPFWDALDAIGVDFYDPLSKDGRASGRELVEGAREAVRPLAEASLRFGKPVYLTEVGYPPLAAAWLAPSDEAAARPFSSADPARAARAVFEAIGGASWCRGLFWWKVFSDGREAKGSERGFNILGRPIETVIRDAYRRLAGRAGDGLN